MPGRGSIDLGCISATITHGDITQLLHGPAQMVVVESEMSLAR